MKRAVNRHGVIGTARILFGRCCERIEKRVRMRETHFWYQCELTADSSKQPLPDGFRLIRATFEDLAVTETFGWVNRADAEERHRDGATLWLLFDEEDRPAFCCWTFVDRVPLLCIDGLSLSLKRGTAALENSYTAKEHRRRHCGGAALSHIVGHLVDDGIDRLVTKIEEGNDGARKAATWFGFREIAVMRTSRLLWFRPKVRMDALGNGQWPFLDQQERRAPRTQASPAPVGMPVSVRALPATDLSRSSR